MTRLLWFVLLVTGCSSAPRHLLRTAAIYPTLEPFSNCRLGPASGYEPERGHVVLATLNGAPAVRRIAGLAGDRVEVREGALYVGGEDRTADIIHDRVWCRAGVSPHCRCRITEESLGSREYPVQSLLPPDADADARCVRGPDAPELVVPEGHVYLLADNRDAAEDSRTLGPQPVALIQAQVLSCRLAPPPREEAPGTVQEIERELEKELEKGTEAK